MLLIVVMQRLWILLRTRCPGTTLTCAWAIIILLYMVSEDGIEDMKTRELLPVVEWLREEHVANKELVTYCLNFSVLYSVNGEDVWLMVEAIDYIVNNLPKSGLFDFFTFINAGKAVLDELHDAYQDYGKIRSPPFYG